MPYTLVMLEGGLIIFQSVCLNECVPGKRSVIVRFSTRFVPCCHLSPGDTLALRMYLGSHIVASVPDSDEDSVMIIGN